MATSLSDWEILQQKIFTRWVNQKLASRQLPQLNDIVQDLGQDNHLANIFFALSEQQIASRRGSPSKRALIKAERIDAISRVLKFMWESGVEMKLKPSPENIVDGNEKDILGLVWALMMKYMRFEDDDSSEGLSAKDALIKWLRFHTSSYTGIEVQNLTKSFHNGMAFCALIHKFRPDLIPWSTLSPDDPTGNLKLAFSAAEKFFGLEQYITPREFIKLDDKSALVYVSEYYYGINAEAKRQLAAKRIRKLIEFTQQNDKMKAEYTTKASTLLAHLGTAESLVADVQTIDNTLAGAQKRLGDYVTYKTKEKPVIVATHLETEETFNTLSVRLSNHNRPNFTPEASEADPNALTKRIKALTAKESFESALHAELHRQLKLVQLNKSHVSHCDKVEQWIADKTAYLQKEVTVTSSGEARKQLKLFDSFVKECASLRADSVAELTRVGATLGKEKFEHQDAVKQREASIQSGLANADQLAAKKKPVLEDDLERELFKEKIRLQVKVHSELHANLVRWASEKAVYLKTKETIESVQEAQLQLSLLEAYGRELADVTEGTVKRLKSKGQDVRDASYKTQYSEWVYEHPEQVSALEAEVDKLWAQLADQANHKQQVLEDALAREQTKEKVNLWVGNHQDLQAVLTLWVEAKLEYLATAEEIDSSAKAQYHLSVLEAYHKEKQDLTASSVASMKKLGEQIRSEKYETEFSKWSYPDAQSITKLESGIDAAWADLDKKSSMKGKILEDALARELYAEQTRLLADQHEQAFGQILGWCKEKRQELETPPSINSIDDAQYNISLLESFNQEQASIASSAVASLRQLGQTIQERNYKTNFSSYTYEKPLEVSGRESELDGQWETLTKIAGDRGVTLQEALQREVRKEELRLEFSSIAGDVQRFCADKILHLGSASDQKEMFGFSLKDVEAYETTLKAEDASIEASVSSKETAYQTVVAEMETLEVTENPYTTATVKDLVEAAFNLTSAIQKRQATYVEELQRHRDNDKACQDFAALAVPLGKKISDGLTAVVDSAASEDDQLAACEQYIAGAAEDEATLPQVRAAEATLKQRGVEINIHTNLTADEVEQGFRHFQQVLSRKKPYLESLIEYKKFRGVSPAQYAEMETLFGEYDKDGTGTIDERELRTCLYSLGEERLKSEVQHYMKEYGSNGALKFEQFRELMVKLLGDTGTPDSMNESFKLLSGGQEFVETDVLLKLLSKEDTEFIVSTAPKLETGVEFSAWVAEVFAR